MSAPAACRVLESDEQRRIARDIVRRKYEEQGYDVSGNDFARYLDGPHARTFGLFQEDVLYGTLSIVMDSAQGLPMDALYTAELAPWRAEGKKISEVVQFAVDHDLVSARSGLFEAAPLFRAIFSYALQEHIDYLCISINPKHDQFYNLIGFKQIGAQKHYASVDAPAIARAFYVPDWKTHPFLAHFLGTP